MTHQCLNCRLCPSLYVYVLYSFIPGAFDHGFIKLFPRNAMQPMNKDGEVRCKSVTRLPLCMKV